MSLLQDLAHFATLSQSRRLTSSGWAQEALSSRTLRIGLAREAFSLEANCWRRRRSIPAQRRLSTTAAPVMAAVPREETGPGQESVWDYPRPPRLEPVTENIKIIFNTETIADTSRAYRVLETSHPPVYYIPPEDVQMEHIARATGSSLCEWKGDATWWTLSVGGKTAENVAWSYESPTATFSPIKGFLAFHAGPMDACFVGEEKAQPQPGNFYGGWVTSKVVGPFKGIPGSWGW